MANGERIKASPLSVGTMISVVLVTLSGGMFVGGLSQSVAGIQTALAQDSEDDEKIAERAREVDRKLARIETRQEAFTEDVAELKEDLDKQDEKLDEILKAVE